LSKFLKYITTAVKINMMIIEKTIIKMILILFDFDPGFDSEFDSWDVLLETLKLTGALWPENLL